LRINRQPPPTRHEKPRLDLEFYDQFFKSGAYLPTHAEHLARWHGGPEEG
jgi:hypothetical protein